MRLVALVYVFFASFYLYSTDIQIVKIYEHFYRLESDLDTLRDAQEAISAINSTKKKVQKLIDFGLIKTLSLAELKSLYLNYCRNPLSPTYKNILEKTAKDLLFIEDEKLREWQREIQVEESNYSDCDSLEPLVELADAATLIILDIHDIVVSTNGDDYFPVQANTLENIARMRAKGARVLFLTHFQFNGPSLKLEKAGIIPETNTKGLFLGELVGAEFQKRHFYSAGIDQGVIYTGKRLSHGEILTLVRQKSPEFFSSVRKIVVADVNDEHCQNVHQAIKGIGFSTHVFNFNRV